MYIIQYFAMMRLARLKGQGWTRDKGKVSLGLFICGGRAAGEWIQFI